MSLRRCVTRSSALTRHSLRPSRRCDPNCGAVLSSAFDAAAPLLATRASQLRRSHDETDNIGVQVEVTITNRPRTEDDEEDEVTADNLYVTAFTPTGFKLSNLHTVIGPCILFPRTILSWNVASAKDITPESLTLFSLLEPRLDVLIIGIGDGRSKPDDPQNILTFCRRLGINVELLNTEEACATFNYLNGESRFVAAALIPPESVSLLNPEYYVDDEMMQGDVPLLETARGDDPSHPRNWLLNPDGVFKDNALDAEMSHNRRTWISKKDADEIRYTESKIKEEIEAMEDRYTPHGEKVVTELEKRAKSELEKDYLEYDKTGEMSPRLVAEMQWKNRRVTHVSDDEPMIENLPPYAEGWGGLDKSERFRKRFAKLYDVGQDDPPRDKIEEGEERAKLESGEVGGGGGGSGGEVVEGEGGGGEEEGRATDSTKLKGKVESGTEDKTTR